MPGLAAVSAVAGRLLPRRRRRSIALLLCACGGVAAQPWPVEVDAALQRARVPADAVSVVLQEVGTDKPLLAHNADVPVNPASLAKLLTTLAALDLLGPAGPGAHRCG